MRRHPLTLLLLAAAGCGPTAAPPPQTPPAGRPNMFAISMNSRATALCAEHRFWKAKVTPAQVRELVNKVREQPEGALVFADDRFTAVVRTEPDWARSFRDAQREGRRVKPDGLASDRWLVLDVRRKAAPPSEADVLDALQKALDTADLGP